MQLLTVPYLGTAERDVVVVEWLVADDEPFAKGEALVVLETLKATFEVEAESAGVVVRRLAHSGERVAVGAPLAAWGPVGTKLDTEAIAELVLANETALICGEASPVAASAEPTPESEVGAPAEAPRVSAAPAARRRAEELGVDLETVTGTGPDGMVRMGDVEAAVSAMSSAGDVAAVANNGDGQVQASFLAHLRANRSAFARLDSAFKVALYRQHGANIGARVTIAEGAILIVDQLVLEDDVRIGTDCCFEAKQLTAHRLVQFGPRCKLRCSRASFGENAFFAADVEIGGGGALDPEAEIVVGAHGFVGEHAHLNPCRPLVLGDEVVISRGAVIMTHSFGASVLEGYPNRFAPVRIGDRSQIGIGAVLFPGVEVGAGCVLMSGSSLVTSMPPGRLWGGVPAVDIKQAAAPLSGPDRLRCVQELVEEFAQQLELRGFAIRVRVDGDERQLVVDHEGARHRLHLAENLATVVFERFAEDVRICSRTPTDGWDDLDGSLTGIDLSGSRIRGPLGPLGSAFREFLRKHGVRLEPRTWTYPGGWL